MKKKRGGRVYSGDKLRPQSCKHFMRVLSRTHVNILLSSVQLLVLKIKHICMYMQDWGLILLFSVDPVLDIEKKHKIKLMYRFIFPSYNTVIKF